MKDVATKDFIRAELRALLEELDSPEKVSSVKSADKKPSR
jgi:hypothetical protein